MNLRDRIERLEERFAAAGKRPSEITIRFIAFDRDENGKVCSERCVKGLHIIPGAGQRWLDADLNPIVKIEEKPQVTPMLFSDI